MKVLKVETKESLRTIINDGLTSYDKMEKRDRLWPSDAGLCIRRNTLNNDKIVDTIENNTSSTRYFYQESGKFIEKDIVLQSFKNKGKLVFSNYKLPVLKDEESIRLSGKIDAIVRYGNEMVGIEVKARGSDLKVKSTDIQQAKIYSLVTGFDFYLVLVDRNVQKFGIEGINLKTVDVTFKENEMLELARHLFVSDLMLKEGLVSPFDTAPYKTNICENCPFLPICPSYKTNEEIPETIYLRANEKAEIFVELREKRKHGIIKFLNKYTRNNK